MKILEIVPQLMSGGAERFVVDLCNSMAEAGHEVELLVFYPLASEACRFYLPEVSSKVAVRSLNKKMGADLGLPLRMVREIRRFNPDVVHTHLRAITYALPAVLAAGRRKWFHTVHSEAEKDASDRISHWMRRKAFASKLIQPVTISGGSHMSFVRFYGMEAPMISNGRNIPAHIDVSPQVRAEVEALRPSPSSHVFVYLARFSEIKQQDAVARACKRLENAGYRFRMLMIGRSDHGPVEQGVKESLSESAVMLGEKSNPLEYLAAAGNFCLLSNYEGLPISLIEALGAGCAAVCTPVGGIPNLVRDQVNGLLAASASEDDIYTVLKQFMELEPSRIQEMRRAARQSYLPYSMERCAEEYLRLFAARS